MEANMGLISRLGRWLDTRFPQKISAEEVYKSLTAYAQIDVKISIMQIELEKVSRKLLAFETGAQAFNRDISEVKDELNKAKAVLSMMNKIRTSPVLNTSEAWKR